MCSAHTHSKQHTPVEQVRWGQGQCSSRKEEAEPLLQLGPAQARYLLVDQGKLGIEDCQVSLQDVGWTVEGLWGGLAGRRQRPGS